MTVLCISEVYNLLLYCNLIGQSDDLSITIKKQGVKQRDSELTGVIFSPRDSRYMMQKLLPAS